MEADLLALGAVALWSTVAALGVKLAYIPPFLLTACGLLIGSLLSLLLTRFRISNWKVPPLTLLLGVYGMLGFHYLLFMALRSAPAIEANLVHFMWPLWMLVLAPLFLRGVKWRYTHFGAFLVGTLGALVAIYGRGNNVGVAMLEYHSGYLYAIGAAVVWSTYSLLGRRVKPFRTFAIGAFTALAGVIALACHFLFEPPAVLRNGDTGLIVLLGLGPMGATFLLWDAAVKRGNPRRIGLYGFLTPVLSTLLLMVVTEEAPRPSLVFGPLLIVGSAVWARIAASRST